jgi:hypothetical protein
MPALTASARRLAPYVTGTAVGVVVATSGTAAAGTAAQFLLGRDNKATHVSTLTNSNGPAIALHAKPGKPPLTVNSSVVVPHLDAALLDGADAASLVTRARAGLVTVWQVAVAKDGSVRSKHAGISVARNAAGDYSVVWVGFPGAALPYCTGIGRTGVLTGENANDDGSGSARVNFNGEDTPFSCALIGLTG